MQILAIIKISWYGYKKVLGREFRKRTVVEWLSLFSLFHSKFSWLLEYADYFNLHDLFGSLVQTLSWKIKSWCTIWAAKELDGQTTTVSFVTLHNPSFF